MTAALIGFAILIALSFTGMPLAFATLLTGFVGFGLMRDWDSAVAMSGQQIGEMIVEVLDGLNANSPDGNTLVEERVKARAVDLCARFPIY